MAELITHGRWITRAGHEAEFIEAWKALADWTVETTGGIVGRAVLVQSNHDPRVFSSMGGWRDQESIDRWRASEGFGEHLNRVRQHLVSVEVFEMTVVADAGS